MAVGTAAVPEKQDHRRAALQSSGPPGPRLRFRVSVDAHDPLYAALAAFPPEQRAQALVAMAQAALTSESRSGPPSPAEPSALNAEAVPGLARSMDRLAAAVEKLASGGGWMAAGSAAGTDLADAAGGVDGRAAQLGSAWDG